MSDDRRVRVLFCDACGAPLDARAWDAFVLCRYCAATNAVGAPSPGLAVGGPHPGQTGDDGRPRVAVGGRTYVIDGLLAHGDGCDVFRGRWAMRLGELVVIKVVRALRATDRLRAEGTVLDALRRATDASTAGLAARLPQPIAVGPLRGPAGTPERLIAVYGWHSGFVHTLHDVEVAHPGGVDPRIAVWVLRRLLELLGLIHRAGWVHGAVVPPHVLVHPRDHGAMLVGFGGAARIGNPRPPIGRRWTDWVDGPVASPATDLGQAARCARGLASGGFADPVAALVDGLAAGRFGGSAWDAAEALRQASRAAYGPAAYNPLVMPGWPASGR